MTSKRILIFAPLALTLFLLQSYLWVPSYEEQTRGNPHRLEEYIDGSIGDASLLNPVLSADSASSQIEGLVFEGLLDRDENLHFRGRLAKSWEINETAYFYVNPRARVPGLGAAEGDRLAEFIREAVRKGASGETSLARSLSNIRAVSVVPPRTLQKNFREKDPKDPKKTLVVRVRAKAPARIRLDLKTVDQDLFTNLGILLGKEYFSSFRAADYVAVTGPVPAERFSYYARKILPAVEHNPVLVFHLRPGVRFHDGHLFDAGDVKFTYEAIMNPANLSPRIADYEPVKSVEVVDPLTVRITYKRLYSPALGTWSMGILPEHLLNEKALAAEARARGLDPRKFSLRESRFNRHPVGCGPFVFREWESDQYILLDRFEDYWEGPPNYGRYVYRIIPDLLTQEMEFYAGTIDSYNVQPHQVRRLKADPRFQSFSGLSFGYTYIGYNMRRKPFDDPRVRRALGMAIDVDKIIRYVLHGQGERITGPFPKQTDYYNHNVTPLPYDPEGALKLLARAGWRRNAQGWLEKDGKRLRFTLITNSGNDLRKAVLAIAQDSWKKIGVDVRTDLLEWSVFLQERVDKADFDALILGWMMGIEPDLYQIWHSSQSGPHQLNFVAFGNREADDLIAKIRREYDFDRQVAYCRRLHEIIAREQPYTFLYVGKWTAVLDKRIVIKRVDEAGRVHYEKIRPTKTGNYTFYFNRWIKLPEAPGFAMDG
ncbi:MAG: peptide ABC transporter substrate-binding protein [Deltaproteobacteria bacterium]|nr:peptide ABC transporter substrate-binding protein [Deltaproteobacteria bacterium]